MKAYYTMLGIQGNGIREVMDLVNHLTENLLAGQGELEQSEACSVSTWSSSMV